MTGRGTLKSLRLDPSVRGAEIAPGTVKRILGFVRPYRGLLIAFLVLVSADAVINVVDPLIYREIINRGILGKDVELIVRLAAPAAGLAVVNGGVLLWQPAVHVVAHRRGAHR